MRRLLLLITLCFLATANAQVATGVYNFASFDNKGFDSINLGNLNVHFSLPIYSKAGRGGTGVYYNLVFDSAVWTPYNTGLSTVWQPASTWGWTVDTDAITGFFTYSTRQQKCFADPPGWYWSTISTGFVYYDQMGTAHVFPGTTSDCSSYGQENINVYDGSGYFLQAGTTSFTLRDPSGRTINPPINATNGSGNVIDTNGNIISTTTSGIEDTTGTTVLSISGSGTSSSPKVFTYPVWESGSSDTTGTVTIHYTSYNILTAFGCTGVGEYSASSVNLPSSVVLADGETYTFAYEPTPGHSGYVTGRLHSITLPTGGVITYGYSGGSNGIVCVDGGTATLTRTESSSSGTPTWTYTRTPGSSQVTTHTDVTDGLATANHQSYDFVAISGDPRYYETERRIYEGPASGTPLLYTETCYNGVTSPCTTQTLSALPTLIMQTKTLNGTSTSKVGRSYNSNGLITGEADYDYGSSGPGSLLRNTTTSYATISSGIVNLPSTVQVYDGSSHELSATDYGYDETTPSSTSGLPQHTAVYGGRGNQTSVTLVNETPQVWQVSHFTYDDAGQVKTFADPYGNQTSYTYDSTTDTFQTQVAMPTIGGVAHVTFATWDVASGANKTTVDQNGKTISYTYDVMERPASASLPDGGSVSQTYALTGSSPYTSASVLHAGSTRVTQTSYLDPYGRTKQTDKTDTPHDDLVSYTYDGNANVSSVSNPYRTGDTPVYSTAIYDALGRATSVTETDSSALGYLYSGNSVTTTDEASHKRKIVIDGLGRASTVFEPDSSNNLTLETDYLYNQNWTDSGSTGVSYQTIVNQRGGSTNSANWRTRTFTYDQIGRVIQENTPEAGTVSYTYAGYSGGSYSVFCSGSLSLPCTRTDANSTVTTYAYDALNRLTGRTYSGSTIGTNTHSVAYTYDQSSYNGLTITNGIGQRTGMSDGSGSTAWSFDAVGRTAAVRKTVNSVTKQANYTYNADGTPNTVQDFGGTTFTYAYNVAGLATGLTDGSGNSYAASTVYNAAGELASVNHKLTSTGGAYVRSWQYNTRMQPSVISATLNGSTIQSLQYGYGTGGTDNGNILSIVNGMDSTRSQTLSYDYMNRLASAHDGSHWGETYTIDNWGNLYQTTRMSGYTYGNNWSVTASANNQLSNLHYDSAGEVAQDQLSNTYSYDAEGRLLSAGSGSYVYDGDGNRVKKTASSVTTLYWPGAGSLLDESDSTGTTMAKQVNFAGLLVWSASVASGGRYLFQDHLGSTRITGTAAGGLKDDVDYLPFGSVVANYGSAPSDNHYTFTSYESDQSESSTDYAVYRNLETTMGRFYRPDPYDGSYDATDPQSLNRYSYVTNRVMTGTDPYGLDPNCTDDDEGCDGVGNGSNDGNSGNGSEDGNSGNGSNGSNFSFLPPPGWTTITIQGAPGITSQCGYSCQTDNFTYSGDMPYESTSVAYFSGGGAGGGSGSTAPSNTIKQTPYPPNTPKTPDQCSIYNNGTARGAVLYKICQKFPNNSKSNEMRGCLQSVYSPQSGYIPLPVLIPTSPGSMTDFNSLIPGLGAHVTCALETLGAP